MSSPFIPVIHSIPSGAALIATVLYKYPINKPHSCKLIKRGLNDTYLVEAEEKKYILRVYRRGWRNKQDIDFELELLAFLHEQKQPVAYPIARIDGGFTTEIAAPEGKRYVAIFSYAPGHAVNDKLDTKQSYILGKVLAEIHQTLDIFKSSFSRPTLNNEYLLDWSIVSITPLYQNRKKEMDLLQQQIDRIKNQLTVINLSFSAPEYGICIGDVHSGNTHFTNNNKPTLFDFDQCGYGWRAFDIAKFLHVALRMKINLTIRNSFVEGYQAIRKLNQSELASIPIFIKAAHIWVMGISTNAVGDVLPYGWFNDDWLDERLAMLESLDDAKSILK
ncbi:phosphotransferase [Komarekiella sp. 'clone 1']|uniref:Phosphotransferase n=1 Tax=Komarekiella delphini-convector SJRDD-AB1 TaxID=2593771 RepID=A0AA40T224_9NOST|nr:phosphotransferase [Komarekiella delphini-convector]MBD6619177.1 phosphotransferase [Komarekiella delphini-convector SJRDD-AB1]